MGLEGRRNAILNTVSQENRSGTFESPRTSLSPAPSSGELFQRAHSPPSISNSQLITHEPRASARTSSSSPGRLCTATYTGSLNAIYAPRLRQHRRLYHV
ncbi:hypothetical protein EX30DRAFT_344056 [Ascodesmis nigricans]|uniref:Uncharacterized protein n=1 Tax=Ascodesmis nigricans TaxID=341454 RepID=A0A4S2ML06_9PEZI|nr:hypothetical protein EX30DRAFT_344056 [Ascodesmis nigricans]